MTTATQIVALLLLGSSILLLLAEVISETTSRGLIWERSYRMQQLSSLGPYTSIQASSALECLRICQLKPVCEQFCFVIPNNSCLVDVNIVTSSSDTDDPDLPCYFRVASCSPVGGYSLVNGRCMKVHDTRPAKTDYTVAAATCSEEGGHLFNMLTSQEEDALILFLDHQTRELPPELLVGAQLSGGNFYWTDGSPIPNSSPLWNKKSNQPDGNTDCVSFVVMEGKLHDQYCINKFAFVCQIDL